jgi:non-specific serine/threonine protein kinase
LGVPGETLWRVPSLSLPDARRIPLLKDIVEYEALRLFVERAAAVAPGFTVTNENAGAVAQVCQRLDGIPLAIELAAARVKVLVVEEIASRLDDRFRLLTGGSRMTVPRQQTLRAAMDWCYELLSDSEQVLLQRLSVFAGGWSLEAAEAVCADGEAGASDILDLLTLLVDKSLVIAETRGGEARYRLLETVRQYGDEKLRSAGEAAEVRRRHRDWYLRLAERGQSAVHGRDQKAWIARFDIEHDNFRAALGWSNEEPGGAGATLHMTGLLWWFWWLRGHWREGPTWLERALARRGDAAPVDLPQAIVGAIAFASRQGNARRAVELGQWGLAACRDVGDKRSASGVLFYLASTARREGDRDRAATLEEESVAAARDAGDRWGMLRGLQGLGNIARDAGDVDRAITLHTEAYAMARESGNPWFLSISLCNLGYDVLQQNDYARASGYFADGLKLNRQGDFPWAIAEGLDGMAGVACGQNRHERAGRLLGAASTLREALGDHRLPAAQAHYERWTASTRKVLGDAAFDEAWAEGQAMTLEHAVEYALLSAELEEPTSQQPRAKRPAGALLTARELDIVRLVARGLTNREIAETLVVSRRTADAHVQNIFNKLGFSSRTRIATWAMEQGLTGDP